MYFFSVVVAANRKGPAILIKKIFNFLTKELKGIEYHILGCSEAASCQVRGRVVCGGQHSKKK